MKIVFVSNFFNHHQKPLSDAFSSKSDVDFTFIETCVISQERLNMGWGMNNKPSYVNSKFLDDTKRHEVQSLINDADVVIWGDAPYGLLKSRLSLKKLTFLYHERIYKKGYDYHKMPLRAIRHYLKYTRHKNLYLLCASAYASADFAKTGSFKNKAFKWGYFPLTKEYDIDTLLSEKKSNTILWCGRLIDWKHPEKAVMLAKRLKDDGYDFQMEITGNGVMDAKLRQLAENNGVNDCVRFLGSVSTEDVRSRMEKSEIFLFTSDKNEGWGAVVNESMNSGCAVVASHAIGSVPFLITNGQNGFIYRDGDLDDMYVKVKRLLDDPHERLCISRNAYFTIRNEWNAPTAANKLLTMIERLLHEGHIEPFDEGVCSMAQHLHNDWIDRC